MTKADLIEEVSRVVEMTRKDSEVIVEAIFDSIVRSLRGGDKIEIRGFGSFRTRERQERSDHEGARAAHARGGRQVSGQHDIGARQRPFEVGRQTPCHRRRVSAPVVESRQPISRRKVEAR